MFIFLHQHIVSCFLDQFSTVAQSCPTLCDAINRSTLQASLSITNSQSSLGPMSIESVMPSNHFILCRPLFLLPPIPPSIRVFSMFLLYNKVYIYPPLLDFPHPTPRGHHRAPGWPPCYTQQVSTSYLFYT